MKLPGPSDLFRAAGQGYEAIEQAIALLPKAGELLTGAADLLRRAGTVIDRIEALLAGAERTSVRAAALVDSLEPSLTTLQPILQTLADTTSPEEVQAAVKAIDLLPELVERLATDIMPILTTLDSVSPDLRDLLLVSKELNKMLGAIPGLGRAKRKFEEEQEEPAADPDHRVDSR